jgi:hypothetical protein
MATAAFAPAAQADTSVYFNVSSSGAAQVELYTTDAYTRFDVLHAGAPIASSTGEELELVGLAANDVVAVYDGLDVVRTVIYDGMPVIGVDACAGRSGFTVQRGADAAYMEAGAFDEFGGDHAGSILTTPTTAIAQVRLSDPLGGNDVAYLRTYAQTGDLTVYSSLIKRMKPCPAPPVEPTPVAPAPPPAPVFPPSELTPTAAQMLQMVRASLSATGTSLRSRTTRRLARATTVSLPFAFPEAGRVELQLVAKNQVIAAGGKASATNGKAILTVRLTPAARKLLKRAKTLKVSVKGAFTPTRNGAETSRAASTVTLKR